MNSCHLMKRFTVNKVLLVRSFLAFSALANAFLGKGTCALSLVACFSWLLVSSTWIDLPLSSFKLTREAASTAIFTRALYPWPQICIIDFPTFANYSIVFMINVRVLSL